jgi:hypothetical protein
MRGETEVELVPSTNQRYGNGGSAANEEPDHLLLFLLPSNSEM